MHWQPRRLPDKTTRLWSFAPSLQIEIGVQPASRTIVSSWAMSAITCAKSLALSALSSGGEGQVLPWLRLGRRDGRQIPRYAQLAPNWRRQKPRDSFEHEVWLIATKKPSRGRPASRGVGLAKHSNLAFPPPDARRRQAAVAKRHRSRPQAPPPASRRCYRRRSRALARHARRHRGEPERPLRHTIRHWCPKCGAGR